MFERMWFPIWLIFIIFPFSKWRILCHHMKYPSPPIRDIGMYTSPFRRFDFVSIFIVFSFSKMADLMALYEIPPPHPESSHAFDGIKNELLTGRSFVLNAANGSCLEMNWWTKLLRNKWEKNMQRRGRDIVEQISQRSPGGRWRGQCRPWFNVLNHKKRKYSQRNGMPVGKTEK